MVELVQQGFPLRAVARRWGVAPNTVRLWVRRSHGMALEHVDWSNRSSAPHRVHNRTAPAMEQRVLSCRRELASPENALGFVGPQAILEALRAHGEPGPSARTVARILRRQGVVDRPARRRWPAPRAGWYLPDLAAGLVDLDAFDLIEGLVLEGQGEIEVLTATALWGPHVQAWSAPAMPARAIAECVLAHWQALGLPTYVQFDNDTRFQGGHNHPDVIGRVARICLSLGVTVVFTPPRETGFQATLEHFNGLWQAKVWHRTHHEHLAALQARSRRFVEAYSHRRAARGVEPPARRPFPANWRPELQSPPRGRIIYLRRTDASSGVTLLGRRFLLEATWPHRLVRCEVDLDHHRIQMFRLRRRDPEDQPLLATIEYRRPDKRFLE